MMRSLSKVEKGPTQCKNSQPLLQQLVTAAAQSNDVVIKTKFTFTECVWEGEREGD